MPHLRRMRRLLGFESVEARRLLSGFWHTAEGEGDELAPDFQLQDTNSTSPTYETTVSPRDYVGQVSGWYFGFGT